MTAYADLKKAWDARGIDGISDVIDSLPVARRADDRTFLCEDCAEKAVKQFDSAFNPVEEDGTFGIRECEDCGTAIRGATEEDLRPVRS